MALGVSQNRLDAIRRNFKLFRDFVYAKPPFGGPQQAIEYLGRYTHRVAISNQRLLSDEDGQVSFQWKDYKHENKQNSKGHDD